MAIVIKNLKVWYGATDKPPILKSVSLSVEDGEAIAIVGESGSGKSTLARAIGGLLPKSATYEYDTLEVSGHTLDASGHMPGIGRHLTYVFQEPQTYLNPSMRIGTQMVEAIRMRGEFSKAEALREAESLLEDVAIHGGRRRLRDYPYQFSGGQAQRVAIAVAIGAKPKVLIADEPTSALDVTVAARIVALLRDLQRERNMTLIHITHNLPLAARTVDRVAVMYAGEIVELGAAIDVFERPQHAYTKSLLSAIPGVAQNGSRTT